MRRRKTKPCPKNANAKNSGVSFPREQENVRFIKEMYQLLRPRLQGPLKNETERKRNPRLVLVNVEIQVLTEGFGMRHPEIVPIIQDIR